MGQRAPVSLSAPLTPAAVWLAGRSEKVIETSCAWIGLAGDEALKIKRPVRYPYLDFSTAEQRRWALERELAFNRRTAPHLYVSVAPLTAGPDGLALGGAGEAVDWVLRMRRFDERAVLSEQPDALTGPLAESLGRVVARAHAAAPLAPEGGGEAALAYATRINAASLREAASVLGAEVETLIAATAAALAEQAPRLEARRAAGFARACHGDLHLGNILLENGRPVLFDCLEFSDDLSRIDIQHDLAFLIMDLWVRGARPAANAVLCAWLDEAARSFPAELWDDLAALPLMLSARAAVRAHVAAASGRPADGGAYLTAALSFLQPPSPRLVAVGGLSGSGKSTLAHALGPRFGAAPGAVILRTDEIRKRLNGAAADAPLPRQAYAPATHAPVYAEMAACAARLLAAGHGVILDAAFLDPGERQAAEAIGRRAGVPFTGLWLEGEANLLRARIAARRGDASDADVAVLEAQLGRDLGPIAWQRLSAADNPQGAAERVARRWRAG